MDVFWAQHGRLFHAIRDVNQGVALCGRYIPPPRMTSKTAPLDDERCAKCDKALPNLKVSRKIDDALDNEDALKAAGLFEDEGDL